MKQILQTLKAVEEGAATSIEASAITGLSIKHSAHWLAELTKRGIIERCGAVRFPGADGRRQRGMSAYLYRLKSRVR